MEETIGFDLRSTGQDLEWTPDRKARFLLRPDVASVRSVDSQAWARPPGLPPAPDGQWLWPDLDSLLAAAPAVDDASAVAVLVTSVVDDGQAEASAGGAPNAEQYDLLGYDVADYDLLGGLANCGYTPEEAAALAPVWAPLLNQWHLFSNRADAGAFAAVTDRRVPEHAPFYAYGIYLLR
jgi:hypothetical protein